MSPAEAITASTINAAYSLNRGEKIGSLEAGKRADFAVFECEDYRELAYWFGFPQTDSVYVKGKRVSLWGAQAAGLFNRKDRDGTRAPEV